MTPCRCPLTYSSSCNLHCNDTKHVIVRCLSFPQTDGSQRSQEWARLFSEPDKGKVWQLGKPTRVRQHCAEKNSAFLCLVSFQVQVRSDGRAWMALNRAERLTAKANHARSCIGTAFRAVALSAWLSSLSLPLPLPLPPPLPLRAVLYCTVPQCTQFGSLFLSLSTAQ